MLRNFTKTILILAVFLAACSNSSIQTTQPHQGNIQQSFTELARTQLENVYDINMPLSGEIERIKFKPGDSVKKDQTIVQLTLDPWQHIVLEAKAKVNNLEILYEQQLKEVERLTKLYKQNFVSQADIDNARFKMKASNALLKQAKEALSIAQYHLKLTTIQSPIDGIILKRFTQGQKWLPEGAHLLQVGNLDELEAVADVLTHQAQSLHVGDPVILMSLDNHMTIKGKIKRIDPAGFTKKSSLGVDEQRVYVIISLPNHKETNLGTEFQLQAQFLIGQQEKDTLIVPRFSVLQDKEGQYYVFKVIKKRLKKQIIEIGIMTDQETEIKKGLADQDLIVTQPTADMFDGMKINK